MNSSVVPANAGTSMSYGAAVVPELLEVPAFAGTTTLDIHGYFRLRTP